ncbi:MAG: peptidoglycan DD-metalloendopeptidase family protein [Rhodocyclaceae bacterium]|nr:peptidoglycan DD-metalloendopeptidase family protein [Rhodocyclaceae bacterium]
MNYRYVLAAMMLAGCASHAPAPVIERGAPAREAAASKPALAVPVGGEGRVLYTVKKGDTLYSIALEHGQDYKDVAAWNNLDNPNRIQVGQQLRVSPPEGEEPVAVAKPVLSSAPVETKTEGGGASGGANNGVNSGANTASFKREPKGGTVPYSDEALARLREPAPAAEKLADRPVEKAAEKPAAAEANPRGTPPPTGDDAVDWAWPAPGKTLAGFVDNGAGGNKGIDIGGKLGEPVLAAAAGKVVYVGSGLRGYGNLVIVRHNASYLSAYAHNSKILVKEAQAVTKGQKIAEIGNSDADQVALHFEIRRLGKPVDPLNYLPAR